MTIFEVIVPPRAEEMLVRRLTAGKVRAIARTRIERSEDGGTTISLLNYRDPRARALVWEIKYHKNERAISLVAPLLAEECVGLAEQFLTPPLVVPIPMHSERRKERGYNQTEMLCLAILKYTDKNMFNYEPAALTRTRHAPHQRKLGKKERLRNMRRSMRAQHGIVNGRTCIVIDDVTSTGATFAEARRSLHAAGAADVFCVALAG